MRHIRLLVRSGLLATAYVLLSSCGGGGGSGGGGSGGAIGTASSTTILYANQPSVANGGGPEKFSGSVTGAAGGPNPTGTVTFVDQSGKTLCAHVAFTSIPGSTTALCQVQIVPPDTVTATYSGDSHYASSSGKTTVYPSILTWYVTGTAFGSFDFQADDLPFVSNISIVADGFTFNSILQQNPGNTGSENQEIVFLADGASAFGPGVTYLELNFPPNKLTDAGGTYPIQLTSILVTCSATSTAASCTPAGSAIKMAGTVSTEPPVGAITTTALSAKPTAVPSTGGAVAFTAEVSSSAAPAGAPAPSGDVTFTDQTEATLCSKAALVSGAATCIASVTAAPDTVLATYSGDPSYVTSIGVVSVASTGLRWYLTGTAAGSFDFDATANVVSNVSLSLNGLGFDHVAQGANYTCCQAQTIYFLAAGAATLQPGATFLAISPAPPNTFTEAGGTFAITGDSATCDNPPSNLNVACTYSTGSQIPITGTVSTAPPK